MFHLSDGTELVLQQTPLGKGGEGTVHAIISPMKYANMVAKIFHLGKREKKEKKISHLTQNFIKSKQSKRYNLIFPLEEVKEDGQFAGYIMKKANGVLLEKLCDSFLPSDLSEREWNDFVFLPNELSKYRLLTCLNIAKGISELHTSYNYVFGDLKPSNIFVESNGNISIIDLDSVQVLDKEGEVVFPSTIRTKDYLPPEGQEKGKKNIHWDNFSLAIIFYRLLTGIHPFTGSLNSPYTKVRTYSQLIKGGFYPHGNKKVFFHRIPEPHNRLNLYPFGIQNVFDNCFNKYLFYPNKRPAAHEWLSILNFKPVIESFYSDKTNVLEGTTIKLSWDVIDADKVEIQNLKTLIGNSVECEVKETTTFTLIASNIFDTVEKNTKVECFKILLSFPEVVSIPSPNILLKADFRKLDVPDFAFSNLYNVKLVIPEIKNIPRFTNKIDNSLNFKVAKNNQPDVNTLKNNYKWVNTLLDNSEYQLSFSEYIRHHLYKWFLGVRKFTSKLMKKND